MSDSGSSRGLSRTPVKLALTELEYTMLNHRLVALIPPQPAYDGGHVRQVPRTPAAITSVRPICQQMSMAHGRAEPSLQPGPDARGRGPHTHLSHGPPPARRS